MGLQQVKICWSIDVGAAAEVAAVHEVDDIRPGSEEQAGSRVATGACCRGFPVGGVQNERMAAA